MPHINRIRVNNVKYNFGTQFYDDFVMRFDGRNALYDLANGGGKSVLMLLLFQNMIPNCTLDDKQPIEKLFRTGDGSTTIHSLIEWKLDDPAGEEGYKYMLTGFCARKAKDDPDAAKKRDAAAIEYFNYAVFYREYNDHDIINLPLSKGRERITFSGLKSYLKDLGHNDYKLWVQVFERKGEYQRFIARYGLYESCWEIIRGINKTEGHVRTYFETHYKTTRKVVDDLLIEEIIQKAFEAKSGRTAGEPDTMAETLLGIKDKLIELSKKREDIAAYDRQIELLRSFSGRIDTLGALYEHERQFCDDLIKTYNTTLHAVKMRDREVSVFQKEKAFAVKHREEISRKLETVKIQKKQELLRRYEADAGKFSEDIQKFQNTMAEMQDRYFLKQSVNDYLEYVQLGQKSRTVRETVENSGKSHEALLSRLNACAGYFKRFYEHERQRLRDLVANERKNQRNLLLDEETLAQAEREIDKTMAVIINELERTEKEQEIIRQKMPGLRQQINALLVEGSEKELRENRNEQKVLTGGLNQLREQEQKQQRRSHDIQLRLEGLVVQLEGLNTSARTLDAFFAEYEQQKPKADKLLEIYHAANYTQLKTIIFERFGKAVRDIARREEKAEELSNYIEQLKNHNPVLPSAQIGEVMDYIRRCHGITCVPGSDYISQLEAADQQRLLEQWPFLPYSVIVQNQFTAIEEDHILREKDFGDVAIPVIALESILSENLGEIGGHMLFITKNKALFYDDTAIEMKLSDVSRSQETLQKELRRLKDNEKTFRADLEYLGVFMACYYDRFVADQSNMAGYRQQMEELQAEQKALNEELQTNMRNSEAAAARIILQEQKINALAGEEERLKQLYEMNQQLAELTKYRTKQAQEVEDKQAQLSRTQNQLKHCRNELKEVKMRINTVTGSLEQLEQRWDKDFSVYDYEGHFDDSDLTEDNVEAIFYGAREAFEKEYTDLEDKKELILSYTQSMQRLAAQIGERGYALDRLAELEAQHALVPANVAELSELKQSLDQVNDQLKELRELSEAAKENKNKLYGSVENAIHVIEEKYGSYREVDLNHQDYDAFVNELKTSLGSMQDKCTQSDQNIEKGLRELRMTEDIRRELERLIKTARVAYNRTRDIYSKDIPLRKKLDELNEQYDRLHSEEALRRDEFEKSRDKLSETLKLLKAVELADEIKYRISPPGTGEEANQLILSIQETVHVIELERDRVGQGLEDMARIKESFEDQCLQRCSDIKTELERLPKLSQITLEGESIPIVQLRIPYVKESFYKQEMASYIDKIVESADTYLDYEERLKYIRTRLSWKNLFSVIVTDMNGIRLNLYKRERIHSQSRYLKYEEAVGSTGQSQGIYIQFLIAIINYIAAINAHHSDPGRLRKVIFIDNPFGAAKDIYIWEPIFELLKTNNVQLVVPARGATPAISGKFDVNYVLGQKLIDQKQQTVVVDYHSNIQIEDVEYVRIEFEQEVFDFI